MLAAGQLILGLVILVLGAELLVRGASKLALRLGISPLIVGLTIVAFGTSSPELAVSINAAWSGQGDIAIGNLVGSNIFNVLFILGVSALIVPLAVHQRMVCVEVPLLIAVGLLFWLLARDGTLGRLDAGLLLLGIVIYTLYAVRSARLESKAIKEEYSHHIEPADQTASSPWRAILFIVLGLALCVVGSRGMVAGAVTLAKAIGLSELIIGLTIIAAGTSLPEVATSISAAVRGQRDIAVGNVLGSNLFNLLGILGITGLLSPSTVTIPDSALSFDIPVMMAVALASLPIVFTGHTIVRWEGALLLGFYIAYVAVLILASQGRLSVASWGAPMLWFVIPLSLVGIIASVWASYRDRSKT